MHVTPARSALHLALAGTLALGGLVGCAGGPVVPTPGAPPAVQGPAASSAVATVANTTVDQGAAALLSEAELDDYGTMFEDEVAGPAAYILAQVERTKNEQTTSGQNAARRPVATGLREKQQARFNAQSKTAREETQGKVKEAHLRVRNHETARTENREHLRAAHLKVREHKPEVHAKARAHFKTHLDARRPRLEQKASTRQAMRSRLKDVAFVDHGDGTKSRTLEFNETRMMHGHSVEHAVRMVHTVSSEGNHPISTEVSLQRTWPTGRKSVAHWTKVLRTDGGHHTRFHEEATFPGAPSRVSDWEKQLSSEGQMSGSGAMVMKQASGKVVRTWSMEHKLGEAASHWVDLKGGVTAKVTIGPKGEPQATAAEDGQAAQGVPVDDDADSDDAAAAEDVGTAIDGAMDSSVPAGS